MRVEFDDIDDSLVGKTLVERSHAGESHWEREATMSQTPRATIAAVHRESVQVPRGVQDGEVVYDTTLAVDDGTVVIDVGGTLYGIGPGGWVEVVE